MAKFLFGWEFGSGLGHASPTTEFARRLIGRGHEVHVVSKDPYTSTRAFGDFTIPMYSLPVPPKPKNRFPDTISIAEALYNAGYHSSAALAVKLAAWRDLVDVVQPDVVIVNFAPTAILAARAAAVRVLQFGTGYAVPPRLEPIPGYSLMGKIPEKRLLGSEQGAVRTISNALRKVGMGGISSLQEIFRAERDVLVTLPELDHYPERVGGEYAGPLMSAAFDDPPTWLPSRSDLPRIFCYLKADHPGFGDMLETVATSAADVLVYAAGLAPARREKLATGTLRFAKRPVHLQQACREADIVVCQGGHGTVATALLNGASLLLMPGEGHAEQWMNANNVLRLKAGKVVPPPNSKQAMMDCLKSLMDGSTRSAANDFRQRYSDFAPDSAWNLLVQAAESLAGGRRA
jgi:UDP:flavonoid glycosyltransferase YjiC (YdhE family)